MLDTFAAKSKICVIGLGYVGLPLAVALSKKYAVIGFDIDTSRIRELERGFDRTNELPSEFVLESADLHFTHCEENLRDSNVYIVTVPTPIDKWKRPDLCALVDASRLVGRLVDNGDLVIFESTVFPGATEEFCAPIIERESKLPCATEASQLSKCFYLGYSPERVNPGDPTRNIQQIKKVTSGGTLHAAEWVDKIYSSVIDAGTHKAQSIKIAEASKVIENIQRDVNIALVNELAILFSKLDIDTKAVLEAACTKWNFLPFWPGLVGGHCIGVDPYYLTHKATEVGFYPEVILAGRKTNDTMAQYVADKVIKTMLGSNISISKPKVLVLGLTFKENCPDIRNSRVFDLIEALENYSCLVDVFDPLLPTASELTNAKVSVVESPQKDFYDAIVVAVAHDTIIEMGIERIRQYGRKTHIVFDVKYSFKREEVDARL